MGLTGKLGNSRKSRRVLDVPAKTLALRSTKSLGYNVTSAQAGGFPRGSGRESLAMSTAAEAATRFLGPALLFAGVAANGFVVSLVSSGCLRFLGLAFFLAGADYEHVSLWLIKYKSGPELRIRRPRVRTF